jgi:AraC-like DNA-binding protein
MDKLHTIIEQNLSNPDLNVEFIVNKIGISRTLFFKKVKTFSGYAPNEYLRMIKMKEAAKLLSTTNKTVSEISNYVGFKDSNYFSKTFKKHFGKTPSVYKNANTKSYI